MTDPDLTSQEQVNKSIGMCRLHGLHNAEATLRALSAALESEREATGNFWTVLARAEAAEAERDALKAELAEAVGVIVECREEIDDYIRHEYPHDHPVQERYRERDFAANPARAFLASLEGDKPDE